MAELRLIRVNRVQLSGRATRDLTLRYAPDGTPVVVFTMAFNRWARAADGRWQEVPGFIGVLASGRLAERCAEHLHKGSALYVEGRLQSRRYPAGDGRARNVIEIRAEQVQFLERDAGTAEDFEAGGDEMEAGRHASAKAEEGELFPEPEADEE